VVIVGAGFGGLNTAIGLRRAPVDVLLVDRRNYHLFQPLLYQVATAALSPADIAAPIRKVVRNQANAVVILGEVLSINLEKRSIAFSENVEVDYDYLVLATGATHSYFGRDEWAKQAPGLKTIEDATSIRRRFLMAFEAAEIEADPEARRRVLTFVIVGGGPTGVELAGAMAEIAHGTIPRDFRRVDTKTARVVVVEGQPRLLASFPEAASAAAKRQLEELGVEIRTGLHVTGVDDKGVLIGEERIEAGTVLWAAGVRASPLGKTLGVELDRAGRVVVGPDLTVAGRPEVFVIGDMSLVKDPVTGEQVPGVAQGAIQMGDYAARVIAAETRALCSNHPPPDRPPFRYFDKGSMAVIGRNKAIAVVAGRTFSGFVAWTLWAFIHVLYLVSFRSRLMVCFQWFWSYLFLDRGARLITGEGDVKLTKPWIPGKLVRKASKEQGSVE
jgi:NADH dehydrogenase